MKIAAAYLVLFLIWISKDIKMNIMSLFLIKTYTFGHAGVFDSKKTYIRSTY